MEGHVLLQSEGVGHAVIGRLPRLGEQRGGVGRAGLGADETLEDLTGDAEALAVLRECRVEARGVRRRGEHERAVDISRALCPVVAALAGDTSREDERGERCSGDGDETSPTHDFMVHCVTFLSSAAVRVPKASSTPEPVLPRRYPVHRPLQNTSRLHSCYGSSRNRVFPPAPHRGLGLSGGDVTPRRRASAAAGSPPARPGAGRSARTARRRVRAARFGSTSRPSGTATPARR